MKKLIYTVAALVTFSLVACGPSAEELAKKEQMRLDSIAQVEAEVARVAEEEAARLAEEAKQKAIQDSITMADEAAAAAAAKKGGVKVKPKAIVKPKDRKAGQGKGDGGNNENNSGRKAGQGKG